MLYLARPPMSKTNVYVMSWSISLTLVHFCPSPVKMCEINSVWVVSFPSLGVPISTSSPGIYSSSKVGSPTKQYDCIILALFDMFGTGHFIALHWNLANQNNLPYWAEFDNLASRKLSCFLNRFFDVIGRILLVHFISRTLVELWSLT